MTLYASNNDCAESSLIETGRNGCYQLYHPNASVSEARLLRALGEVAYDRLSYPFVYYFVVTGVRYRYPVLWLSLLPVGYLAQRAMKRLAW